MNKKMRDIISTDRSLAFMLGGIIISGIGFITIVIAAGIWYL